MNEQDLRDCFAMFAMMGRTFQYKEIEAKECYEIADAMLEARAAKDSIGLPPVRSRKVKEK